jgi:hypothetical protein
MTDGIFRGFGPAPEAPNTTVAADDLVAQDTANPAAPLDVSTIAPTIAVAYGQRRPGDANSIPMRQEDLPLMVWEQLSGPAPAQVATAADNEAALDTPEPP